MPRSGEDRPAAPPAFAARLNQPSLITPDNDRPVPAPPPHGGLPQRADSNGATNMTDRPRGLVSVPWTGEDAALAGGSSRPPPLAPAAPGDPANGPQHPILSPVLPAMP